MVRIGSGLLPPLLPTMWSRALTMTIHPWRQDPVLWFCTGFAVVQFACSAWPHSLKVFYPDLQNAPSRTAMDSGWQY